MFGFVQPSFCAVFKAYESSRLQGQFQVTAAVPTIDSYALLGIDCFAPSSGTFFVFLDEEFYEKSILTFCPSDSRLFFERPTTGPGVRGGFTPPSPEETTVIYAVFPAGLKQMNIAGNVLQMTPNLQ